MSAPDPFTPGLDADHDRQWIARFAATAADLLARGDCAAYPLTPDEHVGSRLLRFTRAVAALRARADFEVVVTAYPDGDGGAVFVLERADDGVAAA